MTEECSPDALRPGTLVGPWRIEGYAGHGTYGAVYRARRAGHPASQPVALKMAVFPYDPRFIREVELLSRAHHPSLPQLLDRGWWHVGPYAAHPYLVMEWVRGAPLYEWARQSHPTNRQVLEVVAQVAWALEVVHRADGLHRDVKGDNILVEPEGRAVLTDFGSGTWKGASPLTDRVMPPNTRPYRSPEALRFEWGNWRNKDARYQARPADDLYALGVTVYRLVTGEYPPPGTDPEQLKERAGMPAPKRVPVQELNPRVLPEVVELIERLLAEEPEERGRALEIAEAAEAAVEHLGSAAEGPLFRAEPSAAEDESASEPVQEPEAEVVPVHGPDEGGTPRQALLLALFASPLLLVIVGTLCMWRTPDGARHEVTQAEDREAGAALDGGTRGLGEGTVSARMASEEAPGVSEARAIAEEMPTEPLPGQRRPPCRGRGQIEINGGCWLRFADASPPCVDETYDWKGACYWPVMEKSRPRASTKPR